MMSDYLMIRTLWETGMRAFELLAVRSADIEAHNNTITVTNAKGGKQRRVLMKPETINELRAYIAADGKHPCGAANYYIDNAAAGGKWDITKPQPQYWEGCPAGLPGSAGGLFLYAEDMTKLSPGWHTLKIDYLDDNTYAPSEFTSQFLVVAAGQPTPTPTI